MPCRVYFLRRALEPRQGEEARAAARWPSPAERAQRQRQVGSVWAQWDTPQAMPLRNTEERNTEMSWKGLEVPTPQPPSRCTRVVDR